MLIKPPARVQAVITRVLSEDDLGTEQVPTAAMRRLWRDFMRPHRRLIILGVGTTAVWCCIPFVFNLTWRFFVDEVLMVDRRHLGFHVDRQMWLALSFVFANIGIWLLNVAFDWKRYHWLIRGGQDILFDLRRALHEKLQRLQVGFYDKMHSGQIFSRVIDDVGVIREWSTHRLAMLAYCLGKIGIGTALLMYLNWHLGVMVLLCIPVFASAFAVIRPTLRVLNISMRRLFSRMYSVIAERIGGIRVVKAFAREGPERTAFARMSHDQIRLSMFQVLLAQGLALVSGVLVAATTAAIFYLGALRVRDGVMTAGDLVAFIGVTANLFEPVEGLVNLCTQVPRFFVVLQRVLAILDEPESLAPGAVELPPARGTVRFSGVSFRYPRQDHDALSGVSFDIPHGATVALMGPSGSGKSTLFSLLLRFYDPTAGAIEVAGVDLRAADLASLRAKVVMVQQEPMVFSGTLADNLAYGHPEATPAQIMRAAQRAELHDFIMTLPLRYETEVGEGGVTLSGGQKQRLALATALMTDPEVLLLDDTTSALDAETEQRIRKTLQETLAGRTRIVITQRIATARACDRIIVLEEGRVSQFGDHAALAAAEGFYRRILLEQEGAAD